MVIFLSVKSGSAQPPNAPTSILRGIDRTYQLDYLGTKNNIQGGPMDLYQNYGTVSCIYSSSEEWSMDASGCFYKETFYMTKIITVVLHETYG